MKKLAFLLFLTFSLSLLAQSGIPSTINSVTVFKQNAEITRIINPKLIVGTQEIVLTGISTAINPSSLQVQVDDNLVTLLSAKYELNYLEPIKNNPEIEELKLQLIEITDELSWITDQREILIGMEDVLKKNQDLGGKDAGFTPNQVIEMSNAYKTKLLEIRKEAISLKKQTRVLEKNKSKIQNQLNEKNALFNKPSGNIVLKIDSKKSINTNLQCTYIVRNAGWNPLYDLRSKGITENVQLNYKANVYQNTGQKWDNVKMTISTGNPNQNNNRPILNPLYTQIYTPTYRGENTLDEVVVESKVNIRGLNSINYATYDKKKEYKDAYKYNATVSTNQINIEFNILNRQTVKTDGKFNLIALDSYELTTKYVYHAVPKINNGAYLLAKITDWGQFNLENGEANIFFEGKYIGKSFINSQVTSDTLLISMGRDNGITVERTAIKNYKSAKFIGSNKKEILAYDIVVKNKKTISIEIEILDQVPVSQNKLISVELVDKGNAVYTEEIGKLLWNLKLRPQESVKERFVYSVKYPKKETVTSIK